MYNQLKRHKDPFVAKTAGRMAFGFTAMKDLKADTISYAVKKDEWRPYFDTFTDKRYKAYVADPDEEDASVVPLVAAVAVVLAPLLFVAALANDIKF